MTISTVQSSTTVFGPIILSVTFTTPNTFANGQATQPNYYNLGIPYTGAQTRKPDVIGEILTIRVRNVYCCRQYAEEHSIYNDLPGQQQTWRAPQLDEAECVY